MASLYWSYGLGVVLLCVSLLWLVSYRLQDVSIVDIWWAPGFFIFFATLIYFEGELYPRSTLAAALLGLWGLRLGGYLAARNSGHGEDSRYQAMRARDPSFAWTSFVKVFWLQGGLQALISLPLYWVVTSQGALGPWDLVGAVVTVTGIAIEAIADRQMTVFKARADSAGRVMDQGLWGWSRHPNYFGNACIWLGVGLLGTGAQAPLWAWLGPGLMLFLLLRVSGVSMLESTITDRRPAYVEYQKRVSAFIPWPPGPVVEPPKD